ncbi:MucR family transcriptional regulator [Magnetospirillum molischianum]|uniref:Transcriptional regulatory protein mucR n=1 Tax=Magnetospirillum molischianum DSM 120 TaxID=1150626 RepID=H8FT84_MAGML|nr:MucR family transcriptional regulator [Magnetospirillum molischianum]CCG41572.1 Transcriptional regulatory protein mucR [Magnetospirillum molischianum DSM 120]
MIRLTSKIVAAFLRNNVVATADLPELIRSTHATLTNIDSPAVEAQERQQPAVPVRKSVTPDAVYCLECGKPQKMLKRHLQTAHNLSVDAYRAKWSLPTDYPMVASTYAARRSELAKSIGLGTKPRQDRAQSAAEQAETVEPVEAATPESQPQHRYPASRWSKPVG